MELALGFPDAAVSVLRVTASLGFGTVGGKHHSNFSHDLQKGILWDVGSQQVAA